MVSALTQLKDKLKTTRVGRVGKNSSQKKHLQASQKKKESRVQLANMTRSQRENNPFELKFTKQKHEILGRKVKGINGRPGVTRKLGLENRARTLGVELKNKNRTSMVIDKRFGENDKSMSVEDKMLARLMKEKTKGIRSNAAFNLDDDTDLTHGGNALSNMDAFDDAGLEAVENDSDDGNIDASIVKYTHFGGFDDDNGDPNARKSRNEIMKEVIAKSKMHKVGIF